MFRKRCKFLLVSIVMFSIMIGCSSELKTLKLSPSKLKFVSVNIGDSVALDVVLKNKYSHPIQISEIKFDGSTDYSLSAGGPLPIDLDKNAEHTISVEFKPTVDGEIYAVMVFTHDGSLKPKLMKLSGIGVAVPRIEISEQSHDYEFGLVNDDYDYDFTIKNAGSLDLRIDNYAFTGAGATGYVLAAGGTTPKVLAANATHTFTVRFAPTTTGTFTCDLEIISNAIVNPTLKVALDGEAVTAAPKLEVDQASPWDFGSVATTLSSVRAIELKSAGLSTLNVTAINFSTGVEFTLDHIEDAGGNTINLPQAVSVGDKIYAMIKFAPSSKITFNDTLTIMHDGLYNPAPTNISLTGVGRDEVTVKLSYTGSEQQWKVPSGISSVVVECYGAEGGPSQNGSLAGLGGLAKATVPVIPGDTIYVYVGGQGSVQKDAPTGGWNGGGGTNSTYTSFFPGTGGGATDIRVGGNALTDRKLVGGGGGGGGHSSFGGDAGDAGGLIGDDGKSTSSTNYPPGEGGSQTAGGKGGFRSTSYYGEDGQFGIGGRGKGYYSGGGGGGAGWYGGGGGCIGAGGGGSSYYDAPGNTDKSTQKGVKTGDGEVIIRY